MFAWGVGKEGNYGIIYHAKLCSVALMMRPADECD
jgi:hypothetical protein